MSRKLVPMSPAEVRVFLLSEGISSVEMKWKKSEVGGVDRTNQGVRREASDLRSFENHGPKAMI